MDAESPSLLRAPTREILEAVAARLEAGWIPDIIGGAPAAQERLRRIRQDPDCYLAEHNPPFPPPGNPDLLCSHSWYVCTDDGPIGQVGLRWTRTTDGRPSPALPARVMGHIGYTAHPNYQGRGFAARVLREVRAVAAGVGLPHVDLVCRPENIASQRVILRCGGQVAGEASAPADRGGWT